MALLAALLMLLSVACAEITLFDSLPDTWQEDTSPLQMNVTVEAKAMSEFDEPRLALLNDLLKHLSFEIRHQRLITENQSHVTVLAEGQLVTALGLQQSDGSDAMMQLSALPHVTYSGADPVTSLLGESEDAFFGLDETSSSWLEDGYQLLMVLEETLGEYCQSKEVNTTIEDMGRARRMEDYTVSKEDAPSLAEKLSAVCPEGPLGELLGRLVFSGKQTLRVYRTEAGVPLRVEYNGACGTDEEHLRTVHILWRLRRDDTSWRDELTLTSPAQKGSDRDTLNYSQLITPKNKQRTMKGDFSYASSREGVVSTWEGEWQLKTAPAKDETKLSGEFFIRYQPEKDGDWQKTTCTPDFTLYHTEGVPTLSGTLNMKTHQDNVLKEEYLLTADIFRTGYTSWSMREETVYLDTLSADELADASQSITEAVSGEFLLNIIRFVPQEDLMFLFADLPEETVNAIMDAAKE
ncbi:MAG: hypothetical protein E7333_00405 [Clostridiales bacterium]|nr:hypothetical protein [Clostridiales bacterium]